MKRHGFSIIEFIIAISVFLIGVMALALALTFYLRVVTRSKEAIQADQNLNNEVNTYLINRIVVSDDVSDISPTGPNVTEDAAASFTIGSRTINYKIYKYQREDRDSIVYNVIQREE